MDAQRYVVRLLAWAARGGEGPPPAPPAAPGPAFETHLVRLAQVQDLAGVVTRALDRLALDPGLSNVARARLARGADALEARTRACRRTLERAVAALADRGLEAWPAGDAAAAAFAPASLPRPVLGAEILVDRATIGAALAVLVDAGFRLPPAHPVLSGWLGERMSARRAHELVRFSHHVAPLVLDAPDGAPLRVRTHRLDVGPVDRVERAPAAGTGAGSGAAHVLAEAAVRVGVDGFAAVLPMFDVLCAARACHDFDAVDALARRARVCGAVRDTVRAVCALFGADDVRRRVPLSDLGGALLRGAVWRRRGVDWLDPGEWRGRRFRYGLLALEGVAARLEWVRGHWRVEPRWVRNRLDARPTPWRRIRFRFVAREVPVGSDAALSRWTQAARVERVGSGGRP